MQQFVWRAGKARTARCLAQLTIQHLYNNGAKPVYCSNPLKQCVLVSNHGLVRRKVSCRSGSVQEEQWCALEDHYCETVCWKISGMRDWVLEDQWCTRLCAGRSVVCETMHWKISGVRDCVLQDQWYMYARLCAGRPVG